MTQLLVPKTLIYDVIIENHNPVYGAHSGVTPTCDLHALNFWWPGMRKSVEKCIKKCDPCQKRERIASS